MRVLVLSDGRHSFKYRTAEKARELKDKSFEGKELGVLKQWASRPWETNYERIPGLAALEFKAEIRIRNLLPSLFPPGLMYAEENRKPYMLIYVPQLSIIANKMVNINVNI